MKKNIINLFMFILCFTLLVGCDNTKTTTTKQDTTITKYAVTYLGDNETVITSDLIEIQEIITLIEPPSKENYLFGGWSDGTNTYNANDSYTVNHDVTFNPIWIEKEKYSITFSGGEGAIGTAPTITSKNQGEQIILPLNSFYKDECAFAGWSDGTTTYDVGDTITVSDSNISFSAVWLQGTEGLQYSQIEGTSNFSVSNYTGLSTEIIIPEMHAGMSVTTIGVEAFDNKDHITSVSIPASITDINYYAFYECSNLETITIPTNNNLTNISPEAFTNSAWYNNLPLGVVYLGTTAYCYKGEITANLNLTLKEGTTRVINEFMGNEEHLVSITLPDSLNSISIAAFIGCTNLETVNYSENCNIQYVGQYALLNTKWYDNLPNGQTYIGHVAYCYKGQIENNAVVTFRAGTVCISGGGFEDSTNLVSVVIPSTVTYIQEYTFDNCFKIASLIVEEGNPVYYSVDNCIIEKNTGVLVQGCKTSIIPNDGSITKIGDHAFNCQSATPQVVLPNSVTAIGSYAFGSCSNTRSIVISENVESIGYAAFLNCYSLKTVTIDSQHIANDLKALLGTGNLLCYANNLYISDDIEINEQPYFFTKYSLSESDKDGYVKYTKLADS